MKKYLLKLLLFFVIFALVVVLAFAAVGYSAQGKEGAVNAAQMGLLMSVMALPFMGFFITVKFWSGYAGRWGEYNYKKELEGDPNDQSKQKDKW